ncbi:hypothetical protein F5J12DRAFT_906675 [Pisolithus orientalis]|uniref:uncharacterized protein n=1 Tax=Pisolithus orientalis TaxID=936130 RepID=UPI002224AA16|nr:uncharacterized protein F5J12DRAFT_906675 [Pisolithus orientalis]KAI5999770.1 hypothetical protein F5J12DRAFT_906675 [Pisolithus orientalis]
MHGTLHLTTHIFTTPNPVPKPTAVQPRVVYHCLEIPECMDRLLSGVDLGILVDTYCQECVVTHHGDHPLHCVREWNGRYFASKTLKELGLIVQLGHPIGERCCRPQSVLKDEFVVMYRNGIHIVSLTFCGSMFQVLEDFHLLSLESKLSCYKCYSTLSRCSDNTGLNPPKARYEQFLRMVHQWHHLKMLKHSGRGHDPAGVLNTKEGECAVLCPACPQPGKNMTGSPERDVDTLFVALDANFHLRCHAVSNNENDLSLSQGWAYFVEDTMFKRCLSDHWHDIQEKSTCSNHNAVNMADAKSKKGCDVTGVGMVVCTRHGMRLPNGIVDLQYSERYVNMDCAFASALHHSDVTVLKVSYNIACQWHKKLYQQMDQMPPSLQSNLHDWAVMFLIPKFHLPAHIASCQWSFSFNWTKGVGQTDGKEPEHGWANLNPAASSMKTMGPGHCTSLLRKVKEAIPEHNDHQCDFEELTWLLKLKFPEQLALWKQQVEDWEADLTKPNPFEVKNDGIMQASICLQLAKDEADALVGGNVTLSVLIGAGIDLEDQQVQQQSNALVRQIKAWQKLQVLFMPGWPEFASQPHSLEDIPFGKVACLLKLAMGQAHNALNDLCQGLRSCAYMLKFKDHFLCALDTKINTAATRYHVVYQALTILAPLVGQVRWRDKLHPLADEDISALTDAYNLWPGEGQCHVSWIWWLYGYSDHTTEKESDDGFQEAICVEWCKACTCAHCWEEEVRLLFEEKQCTLQFLEWHTNCTIAPLGSVAVALLY